MQQRTPLQLNGRDCGMVSYDFAVLLHLNGISQQFTIMAMDCCSRLDAPLDYSQENMRVSVCCGQEWSLLSSKHATGSA